MIARAAGQHAAFTKLEDQRRATRLTGPRSSPRTSLSPTRPGWSAICSPDGSVLPVWKAIWPLFGATNQLLAALALITFVVFLKHRRIAFGFALIPAAVIHFDKTHSRLAEAAREQTLAAEIALATFLRFI